MTTTISLSEDTKDRFDELRPEDVASADEFLGVLLDHYDGEPETETHEASEGVSVVDAWPVGDAEEMKEQLDRIESAAQTAEERTGRIEQTLEDMGARR